MAAQNVGLNAAARKKGQYHPLFSVVWLIETAEAVDPLGRKKIKERIERRVFKNKKNAESFADSLLSQSSRALLVAVRVSKPRHSNNTVNVPLLLFAGDGQR